MLKARKVPLFLGRSHVLWIGVAAAVSTENAIPTGYPGGVFDQNVLTRYTRFITWPTPITGKRTGYRGFFAMSIPPG
jgi:hypothetical protein